MANKMLIDAAHPEETRLVVLRGNRVEDFDFEAASKKPLRGNIYLAKVTRVEPSLQAAFIEYGGNRHGFLAFSEIHPDYYQIPVADRQALIEEEARAHREEDDEPRSSSGPRRSRRRRGEGQNGQGRRPRGEPAEGQAPAERDPEDHHDDEATAVADADHELAADGDASHGATAESDPTLPFDVEDAHGEHPHASDHDNESHETEIVHRSVPAATDLSADERVSEPAEARLSDDVEPEGAEPGDSYEGEDHGLPHAAELAHTIDRHADSESEEGSSASASEGEQDDSVDHIGGDALEDVPHRPVRGRRHYKIQEVIKRRQILLVQVVKEERGNKGAALTTYLSLAGRYSVLMPNTARGGGISRKITDSDDRKRLKSIAQELEVPEGMGIILRTAGAARGETEVKRDFEYLLRMWETVRELTLRSSAPMLVYEEGSLIKRAIRDLYSKDVEEIVVAGEEGYREAKEFMRLLMPTHVKNVIAYRDPQPIFAKAGAEAQLDAMFSNHVTLKSGGYLVINQTEALVAIDVNSGRSTREHNIEDTALRTNLEAADEIARQLRLRDLAGLIVVDFIDMEEGRNDRAVERRIKDALKNDRARIQIGRISHFGLLEMSRQRIRTGVLEGSTVLCPHCAGAGTVRSTSSIALHVLRILEDHLIRSAAYNLIVRTRMEVALYILNQKRSHLTDLEARFGVTIIIMSDPSLTGTIYHAIERGEAATPAVAAPSRTPALGFQDAAEDDDDIESDVESDEDEVLESRDSAEESGEQQARGDEGGQGGRRKRRRRRRGRDRDTRGAAPQDADRDQPSDESLEGLAKINGDLVGHEATETIEGSFGSDEGPALAPRDGAETTELEATVNEPAEVDAAVSEPVSVAPVEEPAPVEPRRRRSRRVAARDEPAEVAAAVSADVVSAPVEAPAPRRSRRSRAKPVEDLAPSLALDVPSADRDIGADTAKLHPAGSGEESSARLEAVFADAPSVSEAVPAASVAVVEAPRELAPAEPPRPKRSGWWQRAKATLTGEE